MKNLFFGKSTTSDSKITADMLIGDILRSDASAAEVLMSCGMHCLGCPSSQMESLQDACAVHGLQVESVLNKLNQ